MIKTYPKLIGLAGGICMACIQIGCSQSSVHMQPNRAGSSNAWLPRAQQPNNVPNAQPAKLSDYTAQHVRQLFDLMKINDMNNIQQLVKQFETETVTRFISTHISSKFNTAHGLETNPTPIHLSILTNNIGLTNYLIDQGAKLHLYNGNGHTPLHLATLMGCRPAVQQLIQKMVETNININLKNSFGCTALHCAVEHNRPDIARELIQAIKETNKDINEKSDLQGGTALRMAIEFNHLDIAHELIQAIKETNKDINEKDHQGFTALHVAAKRNHIDIARALIQAIKETKKNINEKSDLQGFTALHRAANRNHIDIARELIQAIKETNKDINEKDHQGFTALHVAANRNHIDIARALIQAIKETKKNINEKDPQARTALHVAVIGASALPEPQGMDIIKLLVEADADVKLQDQFDKDALAYATYISSRRPDIFEYLKNLQIKVERAEAWEEAGGQLGTIARQSESASASTSAITIKTEVKEEEEEAQQGNPSKKAKMS